MSDSKKHHYLSQFYLAGFTLTNSKEGKLFCFNINNNQTRPSKPINEAYVKYFNIIESNKDEPDKLEKELSKLEGPVSELFKDIEKNTKFPKPKDFDTLLYYVALISIRNPAIRNIFQELQENIATRRFELMISDKKIWLSEMDKINKMSNNKFKDITYEETKRFFQKNKFTLIEPNENKIIREFESVNRVHQLLKKRKWSLLLNDFNDNYFVTSDRPVKVLPDDLTKKTFRIGFGTRNTNLYFPLSKNVLLQGSYELPSAIVNIPKDSIAAMNKIQFFYTSRFIYSPTPEFIVVGRNGLIINSSAI